MATVIGAYQVACKQKGRRGRKGRIQQHKIFERGKTISCVDNHDRAQMVVEEATGMRRCLVTSLPSIVLCWKGRPAHKSFELLPRNEC